MDEINVDGVSYRGLRIPTEASVILLIQARRGFVGCGYFDVATAAKLGERVAIVRGVNAYDDVLDAPVREVSPAAEQAGVTPGMSGREALRKLDA